MPSPQSALRSPLQDFLDDLHAKHVTLRDGEPASYIPELAKADPDWFGICVVTTGGHVYETGDSGMHFTIQSISKPFVYGLALEDNTRAEVLKKISVEPTGDAFNAISLESGTGRPRNPMINAGAIASTGLIAGKTNAIRQRRLLEMLSLYAGEDLKIDQDVYRSESDTGHRNRAIGHMLRNFDVLCETPDPVVDLYFKQCAVSVTCRHLAVMAATLANGGLNPLTGKRAVRGEYVESILSVMSSCGMYDYAGEWLYRVGMPAKSGVAGGVIAVLPGQLGIGVFSPPLDSRGNSVRGLAVCDEISRSFDLHLFNTPNTTKSVIRLSFSAAEVNSNRVRTPAEVQALQAHGHRVRLFQLQGHMVLSTAEVVVHEVMSLPQDVDAVILDFKHVLALNESAARLLYHLLRKLHAQGRHILFTNSSRAPMLRRYMKTKFKDRCEELFPTFDDNDTALEWCEDRLLATHLPTTGTPAAEPPQELLSGLSSQELAIVRSLVQRRTFHRGDTIVQFGAPAGELFFLVSGSACVTVPGADGSHKRLATFSPGMAFGEMALLDRAPRSATVIADTDVQCDLLSLQDFDRLRKEHPQIQITLLRNLALGLTRKLRKANREYSVFNY